MCVNVCVPLNVYVYVFARVCMSVSVCARICVFPSGFLVLETDILSVIFF